MPISDLNNVQELFYLGMDNDALIQSDFTEGLAHAEGVQSIPAGAGAFVLTPSVGFSSGHPGVWFPVTGTTAAGRVFVLSRINSYTVGVGGETKFQSWLQFPTLSTPLQRFTIRTGFWNIALPNTVNSGIGFEYDDSQNGGRWQAITDDAPGVETSTDTGILATAGTWFKHSFTINADGTEVKFFIDNVLVATNTTNIPSGAGFGHFVSMMIMKLIGTASRGSYLDAYAVFQETGGRE